MTDGSNKTVINDEKVSYENFDFEKNCIRLINYNDELAFFNLNTIEYEDIDMQCDNSSFSMYKYSQKKMDIDDEKTSVFKKESTKIKISLENNIDLDFKNLNINCGNSTFTIPPKIEKEKSLNYKLQKTNKFYDNKIVNNDSLNIKNINQENSFKNKEKIKPSKIKKKFFHPINKKKKL